MRVVSVHLPDALAEALEGLVGAGLFPSRSEALRAAVRELLKEAYLRLLEASGRAEEGRGGRGGPSAPRA
jgi:Arc/MetJ-type ribon-helix-helix transcriptional regulator